MPATMTFKAHGQQITQTGATFTTALRRVAGDWRIAAWAWAKAGEPITFLTKSTGAPSRG
jgi:hypothetical protein